MSQVGLLRLFGFSVRRKTPCPVTRQPATTIGGTLNLGPLPRDNPLRKRLSTDTSHFVWCESRWAGRRRIGKKGCTPTACRSCSLTESMAPQVTTSDTVKTTSRMKIKILVLRLSSEGYCGARHKLIVEHHSSTEQPRGKDCPPLRALAFLQQLTQSLLGLFIALRRLRERSTT